MILRIVASITALFIFPLKAHGLPFAGRLVHADGRPVVGPIDLEISFHDAKTGGNQRGPIKIIENVALIDGLFQIDIELTSAETHEIFPGTGETWIQVKDLDSGVVYPRQRFHSVPYALKVPVDGTSLVYNTDGVLEVGSLSGLEADGFSGNLDGDVQGGQSSTQVVRLLGKMLPSASPTMDGQVLEYNAVTGQWQIGLPGASGEVNQAATAASATGQPVYSGKSGEILEFHGISGANGITTSLVGEDVQIGVGDHLRLTNGAGGSVELSTDGAPGNVTLKFPTSSGSNGQVLKTDGAGNLSWQDDDTGAGGEANDGTSLGGTAAVYKAKSGTTLQFRGISAGSNALSITENGNDIAIDVNQANLDISSMTGTLPQSRGGTGADTSNVAQNTFYAGPASGGPGAATMRTLEASDIPTITASKISDFATAVQSAETLASGSSAGGDLAGTYPDPTIASSAGNSIIAALNDNATSGTISKLNLISGNAIDGGTITNFSSTGIVDDADSVVMTITSSGYVGIGTPSPSENLTIASAGSVGLALDAEGAGPRQAHLRFSDNGSHKWQWRFNPTDGDRLSAFSFTLGADILSIDASSGSGRVGVGVLLPTAKLHVGGTPGVDGIRFPDGTLQTTAATGGTKLFCGGTPIAYKGSQVGGYAGAKDKCAAVCGTGARMCTMGEILASRAEGNWLPANAHWYLAIHGNDADDCQGWTSDSGIGLVFSWLTSGERDLQMQDAACGNAYPIACCK